MDFGALTSSIISIETLILMIVIYFITAIVRKSVTQAFAPLVARVMKDSWEPWFVMVWTKWILPALPVLVGILFGFFVPFYPFPAPFVTVSGKVCFSFVAGAFSSYGYRGFKGVLKTAVGEKADAITEKLEN